MLIEKWEIDYQEIYTNWHIYSEFYVMLIFIGEFINYWYIYIYFFPTMQKFYFMYPKTFAGMYYWHYSLEVKF